MGASAGAIRAGQAFVELFVKDEIAKGLAKAQRTLKSWGNSMSSVGTDLMAGGTAVLAPMVTAVKMFSDAGHELDTLSKKTGMSVEWLGAMQYAVGQLGGEFDGFDTGIKKMQSTIADAGRGVGASVDAIERLGLSVSQVAAMTPEQQFMTIGDALSRVQDPAQRAAAAVDIFGRAGTNMLPVFSEGAAGVEKFMQKARDMHVVMSSQMAKDATELHDRMLDVWAVMQAAGNAVADALMPTLKELGDTIQRHLQAFRAWAEGHKEAIQWAFKLAAAAVAVGGALVLVSVPLRAVAGILAGLRAIVIATTVAVNAFRVTMAAASAHPIIAVLTIIASVIAAIAANYFLAAKGAKDFGNAVTDPRRLLGPNENMDREAMQRLQELSGKHLDAEGLKEAQSLIERLSYRNKDLGISVDEATGSIKGMGDAWKRFAQAAKDRVLADLDDDIDRLNDKIYGFYAAERKSGTTDWAGRAALKPIEAELSGLRTRRNKIAEMDAGTLVGQPMVMDPGVNTTRATKEVDRETEKARLEAQNDSVDRALALFDLEFEKRKEKLKEEGAAEASIEALYQQERLNIIQKYQDKSAEADLNWANKKYQDYQDRLKMARALAEAEFAATHDMTMAHRRETIEKTMPNGPERQKALLELQKESRDATYDMVEALKREYIEATTVGEREKQLALWQLDYQEALKKAAAEGIDTKTVDALFEIRRAAIGLGKSEARGMFSPARLEAMGIIDEPNRETAKATREISDHTKRMLDLMLNDPGLLYE